MIKEIGVQLISEIMLLKHNCKRPEFTLDMGCEGNLKGDANIELHLEDRTQQ